MKEGITALALLTLLGCNSRREAAPTPPAAQQSTRSTGVEPPPSTEPAAPEEDATPSIGIAADESPHGEWQADRANRRALQAHRAGRFEESRDGFADAVRLDPTRDIARFNLACAHARLGDIGAAVRELTKVIERDPVRFLPKLREDDDLAAVRESAEGRALLARVPALQSAVEDAWRRGGLPARHGQRVGLWLPAEGRFVALWHGEGFAVLDLDRRRLAWIHSGWSRGEIEADDTYLLFGAGSVDLRTGTALTWTEEEGMGGLSDAQALRAIDPTGEQARFRMSGEWSVIHGRELVAATSQAPPPPRADERPPAGFELRGNALVVPGSDEPIELGIGHAASRWHSFALHPERTAIVVASERETEPEQIGFEEFAPLNRSFVDHVDLRTRRVTRLLVATGSAIVVEHDGDLHLTCGETHRRYRAFAPDSPEQVVPHLLPVFSRP